MPDPEITPEVIEEHGITPEEYERILEVLGREPNFTELGIFSVMWSEHCSYKNTRLLLKTFPDATIVITHRDPVASIQSAITMSCYANRILRKSPDTDLYRDYWVDRYKRLLERCVRDRDSLPEAQVIDVYFDEMMADTDSVLKEIYRKADLPLTDAALAELHAYLDAHPRGKHGKVVYNLKRDFGVEAADIRKHFQFYFDKFPVKVEVK